MKTALLAASIILSITAAAIIFSVNREAWYYFEKVPTNTTPQHQSSCLRHGGQWVDGTYSGFVGFICIIKLSDGGKTCQSSQECQGYCQPVQANPANSYHYPTDLTGKYLLDIGTCSSTIPNLSGNMDSFEGHPIISNTIF